MPVDEKLHLSTMYGYSPIIALGDVNSTEEVETVTYAGDQQYITTDSFEDFACAIQISNANYMKILGIYNEMLDMCPNKKVVHLTKHARKLRTRKKNFNRVIKILEKEE